MINNTNNDTHGDSADFFELISDSMIHFREEMERYDEIGVRIAAKTRIILRVVFITLILSSVYLVYMIYQMSNNMSMMTAYLQDMYANFGTMSQDMNAIASTVATMGSNISGMPSIADSIAQIDLDVNNMKDSIGGMNDSVTSLDTSVVTINADMLEMNARMQNISHSVNGMTYDVREMSLPMNTGPLKNIWPGR
jgi:methyl-accepting chemotaxis protein